MAGCQVSWGCPSSCGTFVPAPQCYRLPPTCSSGTSKSCSVPMSKLAAFCNGNGSLSQSQNQRQCQPRCPRPKAKETVCQYGKPPAPPVLILNARKESPAARLQNVDITEELSYYPKKEKKTGPSPYDCYSVCNCCGGMDWLPACCPLNSDSDEEVEPIKYTRRQRFNFTPDSQDICDPWTLEKQAGRPKNPFDDFPVGKNPTSSKTQFGDNFQPEPDLSDPSIDCPCRKGKKKGKKKAKNGDLGLPTGVYYYSKTKGCFTPKEHLPPKPPVIQIRPNNSCGQGPPPPCNMNPYCSPYQQQCYPGCYPPCMPQQCNPYASMCNPYANMCNPYAAMFNPCGNMCSPNPCNALAGCGMMNFGGMGCVGGVPMSCGSQGPTVIPMCIPSCGGGYSQQCPQQPQMVPMPVPRRRKKKRKKRRESTQYDYVSSTEEETATTTSYASPTTVSTKSTRKQKSPLTQTSPCPTEVIVMTATTPPPSLECPEEEEEEEEVEEEEEKERIEVKEEEEDETPPTPEPTIEEEEEEEEESDEEDFEEKIVEKKVESDDDDAFIPNRMVNGQTSKFF